MKERVLATCAFRAMRAVEFASLHPSRQGAARSSLESHTFRGAATLPSAVSCAASDGGCCVSLRAFSSGSRQAEQPEASGRLGGLVNAPHVMVIQFEFEMSFENLMSTQPS